jgi:hypothetical protein
MGAARSRKMANLSRRPNAPPEDQPWIWFSRDMLESAAFRSLSGPALHVLFRLAVEHMAHAGTENGALVQTYDQLAESGVRRKSIKAAIDELEEKGFIEIKRGARSFGTGRQPSLYELAWLPARDRSPASNRWKRWTGKILRVGAKTPLDLRGENAPRQTLSPGAKTPLVNGSTGGENAPGEKSSISIGAAARGALAHLISRDAA